MKEHLFQWNRKNFQGEEKGNVGGMQKGRFKNTSKLQRQEKGMWGEGQKGMTFPLHSPFLPFLKSLVSYIISIYYI